MTASGFVIKNIPFPVSIQLWDILWLIPITNIYANLQYCWNKGVQYYLIKRTQVNPCTQILSTLFTCLHVMINTDFKQKEMQTCCQQRTKSLKRWPPQLLLLFLPSERLAEWQKKVSLLCLNSTVPWPGILKKLLLF